MKNFKLLLKNSMKSLWNSRVLVAQFTTLTTIATVVISSVSLGNFSLRNSMAKVNKESNATGFSVENRAVDDFASYNLISSSGAIVDSIDDLEISSEVQSSTPTKIYNPLLSSTPLLLGDPSVSTETYGFFQTYLNNNYTTDPLSLDWKNIAFSKMNDSLPIIVRNILDNGNISQEEKDRYKNEIKDLFTLYNDILPPSPEQVETSKYEVFFEQNIYSFNPWSLFIDTDNQMKVNDFGIAKLNNFNSKDDINTNITFNHGIFDSLYSFIVGTNLTFFDEVSMQPYKNEISKINNNVPLSKNWNDIYSNNWKQFSSTIGFNDYQDFADLVKILNPDSYQVFLDNWFPDEYYKFLNSLNIELNKFMQETKTFQFNYGMDTNESSGISKFFSEIFNDPKYESLKNKIFNSDDEKYFSGSLKIPLIPFVTVLPKNNELTLDETKEWASKSSNYTDHNQSIPNISNIKLILSDTFNKLSEKTNKYFKELLESDKVDKNTREDYYSQYDIEYFLKNEHFSKNIKGFDFTKSSNFNLTDSDSNSFILTKSKYYSDEKVNNLVIYEGRELIDNKFNKNYLEIDNINQLYLKWEEILNQTAPPADSNFTNLDDYQKDYFINDNDFFVIMNLLSQSKLNTNESIIEEFYNYVNQIIDIKLFNENFAKWKEVAKNFIENYILVLISWNGGGYNLEFTRDNGFGIRIDFGGNYYEPSSFMSVLSLNYTQIKNNNKQIIDSEFATKATNLPYKTFDITQDELLNNYEKYKDHFIYNPYTKQVEFYNDFLDWMSKVNSKYKISINGDEFIIIGKGISTEFAYPILSDNQLLINNNAPVVFTNELGYDKTLYNNNVVENSNFFVNFNHQLDYLSNTNDLKLVNDWTKRVNNDSLAYRLNNPNQPNQLLYLRINFPSSILNIVLIVTIFIAAIIVLLTIVFVFILMRSIIKQNLNTFAVGMANGISKRKLLFSFMPFVLIPSSISALIGYTLSFFIYPLISNAIQDYWILDYIRFSFSIGYLIFTFIIITLIIFAVQSIVVYSILNKNVSSLLVAKLEFKYNKLVQVSHKTVSKLRPLSSFRITYMLGNFGRLLLLLLMMTSFVSLTTISAATTSTFNNAIQKTVDNKQYNYAIDLYTPTEQGGYYYNIPYNLLGTRQQGLTSLYDLNSTQGFYTSEYKDDLTYNIPNTNESIVYENLFLPSASLIGDIQGNVLFFRNRIVHVSTMNFGINFVGNYINPWEWAKKIIPTSITNTIQRKFQEQLNYAFAYVLSIQNDENNPDKNMWMYDKTTNHSFLEDLNNSMNPDEWNQTNWIFQYKEENGAYIWKTNEQVISTGLPNFTMTQSFVYFVTRLLSFSSNPYYKEFIANLEKKQDIKVQDNNFMLALNVVPVIEDKDETYTYIDATPNFIDSNIKIYGIKPYSEQVVLWDEYNNLDLKKYLQDYENNPSNPDASNNIYPLIINEVVAKKYNLVVNKEIQVKVNNKYNRFTRKFNNIENSESYRFKILGVTTSKSEEQYYTTQSVANKLLEFKKPELADQFDLNGKNYDYKWVNQEEIDNFIPFNGVFSKQELPKMLSNFATLYSPSGLSPISGTLPTGERGDTYYQIFNAYSEINRILKIKIIDENNGKSYETVSKFCRDYENLFNTDKYFNSALSSIDVKFASSLIGSVMDSTLGNINLICILSLLPSILIIIILMSYMIVVESKRLVALLKVLGFSNWSNTITLSMVQFVVVGLSIVFGYCFSLGILSILKLFAFASLNIIIDPLIPLWTIPVTIGTLLLIVSIITMTIFYNLRKTNPAVEIAVR